MRQEEDAEAGDGRIAHANRIEHSHHPAALQVCPPANLGYNMRSAKVRECRRSGERECHAFSLCDGIRTSGGRCHHRRAGEPLVTTSGAEGILTLVAPYNE